MTPFTDISAAIEEAVWLAHVYQEPYCVYQSAGGVMEVGQQESDRNPMFTTGSPGTVTTEYRCAA